MRDRPSGNARSALQQLADGRRFDQWLGRPPGRPRVRWSGRCPGCDITWPRLPGTRGRCTANSPSRLVVADDLPGLDASAGQDRRADLGQTVAAGAVVDARVRPNSPQAITVVSSSMPRDSRSSTSGVKALIEFCAVIADQVEIVTVTVPATVAESHARTPASTSRRATKSCSFAVGAPSYWKL